MKRAIDVAGAAVGLVLLAPLLALIALLVRLTLGSPVLFRQQRAGLHGRAFALLKFRTMTDERDAEGNLLPDAQRLTPFGRFLRSSSGREGIGQAEHATKPQLGGVTGPRWGLAAPKEGA